MVWSRFVIVDKHFPTNWNQIKAIIISTRLDILLVTSHSYIFSDLISAAEKDESLQNEALSWLQWIAKRSKLSTSTTTTSRPKLTERSTTNKLKDPFTELLSPSHLKFPGPPIETSTVSKSSTTSSSQPGVTWSWWSPVSNRYEELPLDVDQVLTT